tara:strand:+ start:1838 stop:2674 length:837 start_codon:yes stop_codon:yes gene_type:complete
MPQEFVTEDVLLEEIGIGTEQVRTRDVNKDVDELAQSINKQGLLQPIVLCKASPETGHKYHILVGQRRFLAHQQLQRETILAKIYTEELDASEKKAISLTENFVRTDLSTPDKIDACNELFKRYGSVKTVIEETGLPAGMVREYIKYPRLYPGLKTMVDNGLAVKKAVRAQDAAEASESKDKEADAIKFANGMSKMTDVQTRHVVTKTKAHPTRSVEETIEAAKSGEKIISLNVKLEQNVHSGLENYANAEETGLADAAAGIIQAGLDSRGFLKTKEE